MIEYVHLKAGRVEYVGINLVNDNHSTRVERLEAFIDVGIKGDRHAGGKLSDIRNEKDLKHLGVRKGTQMANIRQWSMVSVEEMDRLAKSLGLPEIPLGSMGENLRVSGIDNLTQLPIGTYFGFKNSNGSEYRGTVLSGNGENRPCDVSAVEVARVTGNEDIRSKLAKAAMGIRGLVGFVVVSGKIQPGDQIITLVPRYK